MYKKSRKKKFFNYEEGCDWLDDRLVLEEKKEKKEDNYNKTFF